MITLNTFFHMDVVDVARELIGAELLLDGVGGLIVETEAYRHDDPASHSFNGVTKRNSPMFGPAGRAYVYRSYGIHWCFNIVCGEEGIGNAVLIRALQPTHGVAKMMRRRGIEDIRKLCSGPGKLCVSIRIDGCHNGLPLAEPPFQLRLNQEKRVIVSGPRIGISKAVDHPWRFGLEGSPFLSRSFR